MPLWPANDQQKHFGPPPDVTHLCQQDGPRCVATCLAMIERLVRVNEVQDDPQDLITEIHDRIDQNDPLSWSGELERIGMKLAYVPSDIRPLELYIPDLVALDDLFLLSYYTGTEAQMLATTQQRADELAREIARAKAERKADPVERAAAIAKAEAIVDKPLTGPSHLVLLHRGRIYDPAHDFRDNVNMPAEREASDYIIDKKNYFREKGRGHVQLNTKRLFRVVPIGHNARGI